MPCNVRPFEIGTKCKIYCTRIGKSYSELNLLQICWLFVGHLFGCYWLFVVCNCVVIYPFSETASLYQRYSEIVVFQCISTKYLAVNQDQLILVVRQLTHLLIG